MIRDISIYGDAFQDAMRLKGLQINKLLVLYSVRQEEPVGLHGDWDYPSKAP